MCVCVCEIATLAGVIQYLDAKQIWEEFQALDGHGVRLNGILLAKTIIKVANSGTDQGKAWNGPVTAIKILRRMQERAIVPQVGSIQLSVPLAGPEGVVNG